MNNHASIMAVAAVVLAMAMTACKPKPGIGFRLPEGDAGKGKAAFVALQCHACHTVDGVELPKPETQATNIVVIGGAVPKIKTYGQLVTAVINPSHDLSKGFDGKKVEAGEESPMPDYAETMTVRQMTDIVTFLHGHYYRLEPQPSYPTRYFP